MRESRAVVRRGILGAALAFAALGVLHALVVPPYLPDDEPPHVAYALVLAEGRLPRIDTPIPRGWSAEMDAVVEGNIVRVGPHRGQIHTANHPPLFYALAGAPLVAGGRFGDPEVGLLLGRIASVLLATGAVVAAGALAWQLVPGRPLAAVASAWFVALLPLMAHVSAFFYTDGLAVASFTAALAASAWLLRRGWAPAPVALTALTAALAAASRVAGLAAAGAAALAALLAGWRAGGAAGQRAVRAVVGASAVGGAVAAGTGWFYLRNIRIYGDPTGAAGMMEHFGRQPPSPPLAPLRSSRTWVLWTRDYFDGFATGTKPFHETAWRPLTWIVIALLALAVVRLLVRLARPEHRPQTLLPWLPVLAAVVVLCASIVRFIAVGGGLHPRYALAGIGLAAVVVGWALADLGRRGLVTLAAVLLVVHLAAVVGFAAMTGPVNERGWPGLAAALTAAGVAPLPAVAGLAAALAAALALLLWSLAAAGPAGSPESAPRP